MATTPTRAVYLIALDGGPAPGQIGNEMVAAYRTVEQAAALVRQASAQPVRRNAAAEAAARTFAAVTWR
jgi:hypothetical protein